MLPRKDWRTSAMDGTRDDEGKWRALQETAGPLAMDACNAIAEQMDR